MIHLRVQCAHRYTGPIEDMLRDHPATALMSVRRDASVLPRGDLLECDVAREGASEVIENIQSLAPAEGCAIVVTPIDVAISPRVRAAEKRMPGSGTDAVVWEEIEDRTGEETSLSVTYLGFMVLAMFIGAIGVMEDSAILLVGAMVVGPDFGPVAGICVGVVRRHWALVRRGLTALVVGLAIGIAATMAFVTLLAALGLVHGADLAKPRPLTAFVSQPDALSGVVALVAGVAGTLSLTSSKSGPLIGVLISVTTIPAASCVGASLAFANWTTALGGLTQLAINIACLVCAGVATLLGQRAWERWYVRPREPHPNRHHDAWVSPQARQRRRRRR